MALKKKERKKERSCDQCKSYHHQHSRIHLYFCFIPISHHPTPLTPHAPSVYSFCSVIYPLFIRFAVLSTLCLFVLQCYLPSVYSFCSVIYPLFIRFSVLYGTKITSVLLPLFIRFAVLSTLCLFVFQCYMELR